MLFPVGFVICSSFLTHCRCFFLLSRFPHLYLTFIGRERRPRVRAPRAEKAEATPAAPAFRAYIGKTEGLTKTEISESFAEFGKIKSVTLRTVKKIDAHYGFVSFEDEEALTAATKLGTRTIGDVEVVVEVAKTTPRRRTAKKAAKPAGEKSDDKPAPKERKAPTPPKVTNPHSFV